MKPIAIYDRSTKKRLAYLENAYDISYVKQTNSVWNASFKLPYSDYKKEYCEVLNFVEMWDVNTGNDDIYVGLFRIMEIVERMDQTDYVIEYYLEHVMNTLLDSYILGYKEYTTSTISDVITTILGFQNQTDWVLDVCDYSDVLYLEFEDINILTALNNITQLLSEDYYWEFNTQIFPWKINLKKVSSTPIADIRYRKNIFGLTKKIDTKSMITRLYIYGVDADGLRVDLTTVNSGLEYIDSTTGIADYGIISAVINEDAISIPDHLLIYGTALLSKLDKPFITYTADIQAINNAGNLKIGDSVRIVTEDELDTILTVQEIRKNNVSGAPYSGKLTIGKGTVELGIIVKSFI